MRRQQRLRHRQDFAVVYRSGRGYARGALAMRVRVNADVAAPRFGFAVGKRVGNAVVRNRVKRRLRDVVRRSGARGQTDVVVIARPQARTASFADLERTLLGLFREAGLVEAEDLP